MKFTAKLTPNGRTSILEIIGATKPPYEVIGTVTSIEVTSPFKPEKLEMKFDTKDANSLLELMKNFSISDKDVEDIAKGINKHYEDWDKEQDQEKAEKLLSMFNV